MVAGQMTGVVRYLRRAALRNEDFGSTDGQLLESFLTRGSEAAFEALVRRHGPMVLGVCRRMLGDAHDAEDAFQATFLVLVRRAASVQPREQVGHWLYGVAYRTALKARAMAGRHRAVERQVKEMARPPAEPDHDWHDLQPLLDRELAGLPEKYRVALVLCNLGGKSKREAARHLGVPEGTVSSRVARGRELLRQRLGRRGLTLSAGTLAAILSSAGAAAALPAPLVNSTVEAAMTIAAGKVAAAGVISAKVAALTQGVIQAMFLTKLKIATAVVLALGLIAASAGVLAQRSLADKPTEKPAAGQKPEVPDKKGAGDAKKEPMLSGIVHSFDAAKGTITVTFRKLDDDVERTFDLGKDAKLLVDGKEAKPADLKAGHAVILILADDGQTVRSLRVHGPTISGELKSVDAATHTIQLIVKKTPVEEDITYKLDKDARIVIAGRKEAGLADLQKGASASVTLSADKTRVVAVFVGPKKEIQPVKKEPAPPQKKGDEKNQDLKKDADKPSKPPDLTGQIEKVANDFRTITLSIPAKVKGEPPTSVEIKLTDKTKITYFGVEPNGENLTVGYVTQVWLVEGSQDTAAGIRLGRKDADAGKGPDLSGRITAVSKDLRTITLEVFPKEKGDQPTKAEIKLTEKTKFSYFGVDQGGETPTVGYIALVWLVEGSKDTAAGLRLGVKN